MSGKINPARRPCSLPSPARRKVSKGPPSKVQKEPLALLSSPARDGGAIFCYIVCPSAGRPVMGRLHV
jgi:hypothetical protein